MPSLSDPAAPEKRTQFYSMLGMRAIYHDGWLANTLHPPISGWGNFNRDEWELYKLNEDRAQTRNVAAEHPSCSRSSRACGPTTRASSRAFPWTTGSPWRSS